MLQQLVSNSIFHRCQLCQPRSTLYYRRSCKYLPTRFDLRSHKQKNGSKEADFFFFETIELNDGNRDKYEIDNGEHKFFKIIIKETESLTSNKYNLNNNNSKKSKMMIILNKYKVIINKDIIIINKDKIRIDHQIEYIVKQI